MRELEIVSDIEQIPSRPPRNISLREGDHTEGCDATQVCGRTSRAPAPTQRGTPTLLDLRNYVVTQQLPERDGVFEYSVMSPTEPYERVFIESELRAVEGGSSRPSGNWGVIPRLLVKGN